MSLGRAVYFSLGTSSLLVGLVGVFLPLLPTTPFVLLAAFCFSRSSSRVHSYLLNHRLFGPIIGEWERHGVIPLKVKVLATTMMLVMVSYPLLFLTFSLALKLAAAISVVVALLYIWTRPSRPDAERS